MTYTAEAISLTSGHIAGIPIEETLGSLGPALVVVVAVGLTTLRVRLRHARRAGRGKTSRYDPTSSGR